ncbi:MAG: PrsW family intramembrane metalloprotease [Bacteroidales bacterium]|nr:PrsW family intramembrane metalloprotease [Bacteroidales bacterium]
MMIMFLAVLPVLLLLYYVYSKDRRSPEPLSMLVLAFLVGCFSCLPASIMEQWLMPFAPNDAVLGGLFEGYVVAGLSEELCKLVLLMLVVWRSRHFDEHFDGIVYAVFVSMGFACIENVGYVLSSPDAQATAFMRGLLAVPAHFLFAVAMGYHLSLAKFSSKQRAMHLLLALVYPVLLHGTYDSLLMVSERLVSTSVEAMAFSGLLSVLFIVFDIRMWRWGLKRIKRMQIMSQTEGFDRCDPFKDFKWTD